MKVLERDASAGRLRLRIDTLDDLWCLRNLLHKGDLATAHTFRTPTASEEKVREGKLEKRPVRLGVRVETVEWHDFDDHLRILGPIEAGAQDHGRHHTLILRPGDELVLDKRGGLAAWHDRMLEDAAKDSAAPKLLLLAIDDTEAQFAVLRGHGLQVIGTLPAGGQGKRYGDPAAEKRRFYDEAAKSLKALRPAGAPLVVVGPGWWRDEFLEHLRKTDPSAASEAKSESTSQGGATGLHEAIRNGLLERVARDHRIGRETALVERLLSGIATDGAVSYGPADVEAAVAAGAVEHLLVSDETVRSGVQDALLRRAESARARIHVVSGAHDAGRRLRELGGLAALLRFKP